MRVLVPFGIMLVAVGSASVAWACTPSSTLSGVSPSSGPAGTAVTVTGEGYSAGGPVDIRWGSATGLLLASTQGANFSVEVTIPNAREGNYALVAIDLTTGQARSGIFALGPGSASPPSQPTESFCANVATGADSFRDDDGTTFEAVIECLVHSGITAGGPGALPVDRYGPYLPVTRAQMATFIARELDAAKRIESETGVRGLAAFDGANQFVDVAPGNVHLEAINRLSRAGITAGGPEGRPANQFGPNLPVSRAQMAAFIDRGHHLLIGAALGPVSDYFIDDDGHLHETSINGIAVVGIAVGDGRSTFRPQDEVSRGQMAAFLIRHLAVLEEKGAITPLPA